MSIEDTRINLVEQRGFHTFAFNGQVHGPLIHVVEGDDVEVTVTNMTALPHTTPWSPTRCGRRSPAPRR